MHDVRSVCEIIRQQSRALAPCLIDLGAAGGTRLAEPICMDIDSPPFDRALVDGYALVSAAAPAGGQLRILGRQDAGSNATFQVGPGTCVAINTGAPLPVGADAVVMVEETRMAGAEGLTPKSGRLLTQESGMVIIQKAAVPGGGLQRRGSDARAGEEVLTAGKVLSPAALAVAAAAGAQQVRAIPLPRVAVLVTGDELVDPATVPSAAQIRNTNSVMLAGCVKAAGASLVRSSIAGDQLEKLRAEILSALAVADVLVISGGMSMGTRDLIPDLLAEIGFTLHIEKVRIKPGKPFLFGTLEARSSSSSRRYVLGLPGNPVSAFVCFQRFGRILLDRLAGGPGELPMRNVLLASPIKANSDREFYQSGIVGMNAAGQEEVTPLTWRGSADIFTLAQANALIVVPPNSPARSGGDRVEVLALAP